MFIFMDETDVCAVYITVMSEMSELTVGAQEDVWTLTSEDGESLAACLLCLLEPHKRREMINLRNGCQVLVPMAKTRQMTRAS